ncbi:acyl-CoA dehydrogenase family protein [Haliangium sp.]|uniref:acyl-CoA dehydrogenase family protein n=1 Tax=Haliangium sp. TaxID=2663208 RepID=UPI003D141692
MLNPAEQPARRLGLPLTEEQLLIGDSARSFGRDRLAPGAAARDHDGTFPMEFMGALAEMGLLAMKVASEDGGVGTDNVGYLLAIEGIAESCASTAVVLSSSNMAAYIVAQHGSPEQRERWLRPYADGELGPLSFALSEPHSGSDAAALTTTAVKDGDSYVLNGSKMWITSGAYAGAHVVFARVVPADGPAPTGSGGISCFVVERGTPGLTIGREEDKMGQRASGTVALFFEDCRVPAENLVGAPGRGYGIALSALGAGRVGIAGLSLGIGERAFAEGLAYAGQRKAFGRRVADFQNSQFVLADVRTQLDAAWLLSLRAALLLDSHGRAPMESSMAKMFATEAAHKAVDDMLQLHGGYGYSREYAIERLYRDARVTRIYEGTSEIQRVVIAREILRCLDD